MNPDGNTMSYRAGIIGAGGIAGLGILGMHNNDDIGNKKFKASHAGGYLDTEGVDLVAIADRDAEKLRKFGNAWDIPDSDQYPDHQAMLESEDLDVISVCTPTFLHRDHVVDAVRSPAAPSVIWCEKPIASSVSDANEMVAACENTDTELLINHAFRFTDKLQTLQSHVRDGLIGDITAVTTQFRRELLRASTHQIDMLFFLADTQARLVSGYINGENNSSEILESATEVDDAGGGGFIVMDDGMFATVDCTMERPISSMMFHIIGTEGKLYLNNDDGEWRYWRLEDGEHVEESIPDVARGWTWEQDYESAFANTAQHAVDLVDDDVSNLSSGREATKSLEVIIGFFISHYTGSHVDIPFDRPLRDVEVTSW